MVKVAMQLISGKFVHRPNRFVAVVNINGEKHPCHVQNPGRMEKFLVKGAEVLVEHRPSPRRKTQYSMLYVVKNGIKILLDSQLSNDIFHEGLKNNLVDPFSHVRNIRREVPYGEGNHSRIDFLLDNSIYLEVKSVNYAEGSVGLWPDAPSKRGRKHVVELIDLLESNEKLIPWIVFLVQRSDIHEVRPFDEIDPEFGKIFRVALEKGVQSTAFAITYSDGGKEAKIGRELPVVPEKT